LPRLIRLVIITVVTAPMMTQCDPGSPTIPQCARPGVDALSDDCPHVSPDSRIKFRVGFDGPVDVVMLVDGSGWAGSPETSPWVRYVDHVNANASLTVTNRTKSGFATCLISRGGRTIKSDTISGYGKAQCVMTV
jgi:hypothetical protein